MTEAQGSTTLRQEPLEVSGKFVTLGGALIAVVSLAFVGIMALILWAQWGASARPVKPVASGLSGSPLQRSNILETAKGQELQEQARRDLDQWGWVEEGKVARIPVKEAARWLIWEADQDLAWRSASAPLDAAARPSPNRTVSPSASEAKP